jgi:membrane protease subunit HflK
MKLWIGIAAILGLLAYVLTGLTVIQPDEVGIVRRFGAILQEPWDPGLHWGLPLGIDRLDRVKPAQTRSLTVGARDPQGAALLQAPNPETDDLLTGDLNLVTTQVIIQYRVVDPAKYLFSTPSVEDALKATVESELARSLVGRSIDDVLTTGRAQLGEAIHRSVQARADSLGLGISIRAVGLGRMAPPMQVAPAFADAARARSDLRQTVTRAQEYAERARADSASQAREIADRAAARSTRTVQVARGQAEGFLKVHAESSKSPEATRRRLYLAALATLLPRFQRTLVVAPGQNLDLSLIAIEPKNDKGDDNADPNPGK